MHSLPAESESTSIIDIDNGDGDGDSSVAIITQVGDIVRRRLARIDDQIRRRQLQARRAFDAKVRAKLLDSSHDHGLGIGRDPGSGRLVGALLTLARDDPAPAGTESTECAWNVVLDHLSAPRLFEAVDLVRHSPDDLAHPLPLPPPLAPDEALLADLSPQHTRDAGVGIGIGMGRGGGAWRFVDERSGPSPEGHGPPPWSSLSKSISAQILSRQLSRPKLNMYLRALGQRYRTPSRGQVSPTQRLFEAWVKEPCVERIDLSGEGQSIEPYGAHMVVQSLFALDQEYRRCLLLDPDASPRDLGHGKNASTVTLLPLLLVPPSAYDGPLLEAQLRHWVHAARTGAAADRVAGRRTRTAAGIIGLRLTDPHATGRSSGDTAAGRDDSRTVVAWMTFQIFPAPQRKIFVYNYQYVTTTVSTSLPGGTQTANGSWRSPVNRAGIAEQELISSVLLRAVPMLYGDAGTDAFLWTYRCVTVPVQSVVLDALRRSSQDTRAGQATHLDPDPTCSLSGPIATGLLRLCLSASSTREAGPLTELPVLAVARISPAGSRTVSVDCVQDLVLADMARIVRVHETMSAVWAAAVQGCVVPLRARSQPPPGTPYGGGNGDTSDDHQLLLLTRGNEVDRSSPNDLGTARAALLSSSSSSSSSVQTWLARLGGQLQAPEPTRPASYRWGSDAVGQCLEGLHAILRSGQDSLDTMIAGSGTESEPTSMLDSTEPSLVDSVRGTLGQLLSLAWPHVDVGLPAAAAGAGPASASASALPPATEPWAPWIAARIASSYDHWQVKIDDEPRALCCDLGSDTLVQQLLERASVPDKSMGRDQVAADPGTADHSGIVTGTAPPFLMVPLEAALLSLPTWDPAQDARSNTTLLSALAHVAYTLPTMQHVLGSGSVSWSGRRSGGGLTRRDQTWIAPVFLSSHVHLGVSAWVTDADHLVSGPSPLSARQPIGFPFKIPGHASTGQPRRVLGCVGLRTAVLRESSSSTESPPEWLVYDVCEEINMVWIYRFAASGGDGHDAERRREDWGLDELCEGIGKLLSHEAEDGHIDDGDVSMGSDNDAGAWQFVRVFIDVVSSSSTAPRQEDAAQSRREHVSASSGPLAALTVRVLRDQAQTRARAAPLTAADLEREASVYLSRQQQARAPSPVSRPGPGPGAEMGQQLEPRLDLTMLRLAQLSDAGAAQDRWWGLWTCARQDAFVGFAS